MGQCYDFVNSFAKKWGKYWQFRLRKYKSKHKIYAKHWFSEKLPIFLAKSCKNHQKG
jgi:hypothetical protein